MLTSEANRKKPYKWNRDAKNLGVRARVFCSSLSDVFDAEVPQEWRDELWVVIEQTPNLDWLLLTKRPENILKMLPLPWLERLPSHVWVGTSCEDQETLDYRVRYLKDVRASVRFLSCEPLLGSLNLKTSIEQEWIDWVIVGGESGSHARSVQAREPHVDAIVHAIEEIHEQCIDPVHQGKPTIPLFVKQLGTVYARHYGFEDRKGENPDEWPVRLRAWREFPVIQLGGV